MVFLWIAAYGLVYSLASCLLQTAYPWAVPLAMVAYAAALIGWVFRTGQARFLGFCAPRWSVPCDFYLVFLLLPACNLLTAKTVFPNFPSLFLMLSVCAVEEIFFRGFLLRWLLRFGSLPAILFSSGIFALFHLVNLIGGSDFAYTWMQILCAFTAGICYSAVAIQLGSLIPCFFAHFLTNITAVPISAGAVSWFWLCVTAYGCLGFSLCKKVVSSTT